MKFAIKKYHTGFTLLETVIVLAILGILSLFGMLIITSFQKDALLDSTAREFASALKSARNKSINSELPEGKTASDYAENGLPEYGITTIYDNLKNVYLYYIYYTADPAPLDDFTLKAIQLDSKLSITVGNIVFAHLTGKTTATDFTISNSSNSIKVSIDANGMTTIIKI